MANELTTSLGFEATAAIAQLNALQAELVGYNQVIASAATGTAAFNVSGARFDKSAAAMAGSMAKISTSAKTTAASTATLRSQIQQAEQSLRDVFRRPIADAKSLGDVLNETGKKGKESGRAVLLTWQSVARIFAIQTIHRFITLITNAFADGVQKAKDYEISLAEIGTIGDQLGLSLDEVGERVRAISEEFAQPIEVVSEGLYQTLSNQVAQAGEEFEFLRSANRFAVAAVTDTASAVNLLSSTLNSYGIAASRSDEVAGKLFKTIELGRIRGEEFANTFGRVTVLSNQLGVSLEEVLASIATLTVQGLKYNEAFTLITNTQLKLIRPTEALQEAFKDMGVASAEAGIQAYGFQGFLERLTEQSGDTASEIGGLFNRVRAVRGVLGLTGNQAERFADTLRQIEEAGELDVSAAAFEVFQTEAKQFEKELTKITNFFIDDFGRGAIKVMNDLISIFGGGVEALTAFGAALAAAGGAYITFVAIVAAKSAIAAVSMGSFAASVQFATLVMWEFLATNPVGWAILAATAVGTLVVAYNHLTTSVQEAADATIATNEAQLRSTIRTERLRRRALEKQEKEALASTQAFLIERQRLYLEDAKEAEDLQNRVFGGIADQVENRLSAFEEFVEGIRDHTADAARTIRDLQEELLDVGDRLDEFNFQESIEGLNAQQQAQAKLRRSTEFLQAANEALRQGDHERAEILRAQAEQAAKSALRSAKEAESVALVRHAREGVRDAIKAQRDLLLDQVETTKEVARLNEAFRPQEEARLGRIRQLVEKLREFELIADGAVVDPELSVEDARKGIVEVTEALKRELAAAGKDVAILAQVQPDLDALRFQITEAFRDPITGVKIDLTDAVTLNFDRIVSILSRELEKLTAEQIQALSDVGIKVSIAGFGEAQTAVGKLDDSIKDAAKSTIKMSTATSQFSNELTKANAEMVKTIPLLLRAEETRFGDTTGAIAGKLADMSIALKEMTVTAIPAFGEVGTETENLAATLGDVFAQFREAATAQDIEGTTAQLNRLDTIIAQLVQTAPNAAAQLKKAADALDAVQQAMLERGIAQDAAETLGPLEQRVKALGAAFGDTATESEKVGIATRDAANIVVAEEQRKTRAIEATTRAYREQQEVAGGGGGGGQQGRYRGGLVYRADGGLILDPYIMRRALGGFTPRGTDTQLIAATPGESVNTVAATQRFFPQIQAMNAGVTPTFREQGGTVVNNTGDVNLNVTEAASSRETAREVLRLINRERRRDTTSIRSFK